MSFKAVAWTLLAVLALALVLLFNYWAAFQPLSTLVYSGIVLALCGLANFILPFRFLGIRRRVIGAVILAGGVALAAAALYWPASTIRVAQTKNRLDEFMPEYQFSERHSVRVHARREQVMEAIRQSTFGDMTSLITLLRIRGLFVQQPDAKTDRLQDKRILDAFTEAGYFSAGSENEIAMFGIFDVRTQRRPDVHTLQDFAAYRQTSTVKMGYDFLVEDAGKGWFLVKAETRVAASTASRGMACYWRLIVPGSGLLRLQWLDGIKSRAEGMPSVIAEPHPQV